MRESPHASRMTSCATKPQFGTHARWLSLAALGWLGLGCSTAPEAAVTPPTAQAKLEVTETLEVATPTFDTPTFRSEQPRTRPDPKPVSSRDEALEAATRGNQAGAVAFLKTYLEQQPNDREARLAMARALRALGQRDEARAALALGRRGSATIDQVLLSVTLLRDQGQYRAAAELLQTHLNRAPADPRPLQGELLDVLGDLGELESDTARQLQNALYDAYDNGSATTAEDLLAVAQAAISRGSRGAFKDANMVLQDAEELSSAAEASLVSDRIRLVQAHMFAEKYANDEAMVSYEQLLSRDPWHPAALAGSAQVLATQLQFGPADRLAREALLVDPTHPDAHALLAKLALIEGRRDEAEQHARLALSVNPHHTQAHAVLAGLGLVRVRDEQYAQARDAALANNPHNGRFFTELADILGFVHLYPESETVLLEGIAAAPKDPYVRAARGLNLLRLGAETQARTELQQAWRRDPFNERTRNVLDLYEHTIDPHYVERQQSTWILRLPDQDSAVVEPWLVQSVDASLAALNTAYSMQIDSLRLEFFRQPDAFSVRTVGVPNLGAVAVCFGPVITLLGPYRGTHNIDNVIRHELAHVYAIRASQGRVPRWFTEGLSEWESELANPAWARESAVLLAQARAAGKLRHLHELELAFIRADSPIMMEVAYATAAYAIRYLGQRYGRDRLMAVLAGYATGETSETLFEHHLGDSFATIEADFETWFSAELDRKVRGWHPISSAEPTQHDRAFARARAQVEANDFDSARQTLQSLIDHGADGYAPRMLMGTIEAQSPAPHQAIEHYQAAQAFHTEAIEPWVALADLARRLDDPTRESTYLTAAMALDADAFEPAARLLMLSALLDDADAFERAWAQARAVAPTHPATVAAWLLAPHHPPPAVELRPLLTRLKQGLKSDAVGPADTWVLVALAAEAMGDTGLARRSARQALQIGNLPTIAHTRLAALSR